MSDSQGKVPALISLRLKINVEFLVSCVLSTSSHYLTYCLPPSFQTVLFSYPCDSEVHLVFQSEISHPNLMLLSDVPGRERMDVGPWSLEAVVLSVLV